MSGQAESESIFEPPPGGDVSLRSDDGVVFVVHSIVLGLVSSVFSDMFLVGRPSGDVIQLDDSSSSISLMLAFVYPSSITPTIRSLDTLEKCLKIAQKYNIEKINKTLDRDLPATDPSTKLISRSDPLRAFRLARTYGLRACQTIAASAIGPYHIDFLDPAKIVEAAKEYPTAASIIGLIAAQNQRAKVLSKILFEFEGNFLPKADIEVTAGQATEFTDVNGGELMMCDKCASKDDQIMLTSIGPIEYIPSWIHGWSRATYQHLMRNRLDPDEYLFKSEDFYWLAEDYCMEACQGCIDAVKSAKPNYSGRPGGVFDKWASDVCRLLIKELGALDCLYAL